MANMLYHGTTAGVSLCVFRFFSICPQLQFPRRKLSNTVYVFCGASSFRVLLFPFHVVCLQLRQGLLRRLPFWSSCSGLVSALCPPLFSGLKMSAMWMCTPLKRWAVSVLTIFLLLFLCCSVGRRDVFVILTSDEVHGYSMFSKYCSCCRSEAAPGFTVCCPRGYC